MDMEGGGSITGRIASFVHVREDQVQFVLAEQKNGWKVQCFVDLENWDTDLDYGDVIRMSGWWKKPDVPRNPGEFDYPSYLLARNIGLLFYGEEPEKEWSGKMTWGVVPFLVDLRCRAMAGLDRELDPAYREFAKGVLFGERGLGVDDADLFSRVGIAHLLAVSGLHVGIIYGAVVRVFRRMQMPVFLQMFILAFLFCTYAFWCDFSISVIRAGGMAMIQLMAQIYRRNYDSIQAMALVGCATMAYNPYLIGTASFMLSYAAVFSIAAFQAHLVEKANGLYPGAGKIGAPLLLSLCVVLFSYPMVSGIFNRVAVLSVFLNLAAVPIAGVILLVLLISSIAVWVGLGYWAVPGYKLSNLLIGGLYQGATLFDGISWQSMLAPALPVWRWSIHYLFMGLVWGYFYTKKQWSIRLAIVLAVFMVWIPVLENGFGSEMRVSFLDVGQGDAAVLELPGGEVLLVDGGGSEYRDMGADVVLPAILSRGIKKVDILLCTHSHSDHLDGLRELIDLVEVSAIVVNPLENEDAFGDFLLEARRKGIKIVLAGEGSKMTFKRGVRLEFLHPFTDQYYKSPNDSSLVFRISYGETAFLFTGDVEGEGEKLILGSGASLQSQVLKIAHHGSSTSSMEDFIRSVDPDFAVVSVGERNPYGHPGYKTLELLEEEGVQYYRTDMHGAVVFSTDGKVIQRDHMVKE